MTDAEVIALGIVRFYKRFGTRLEVSSHLLIQGADGIAPRRSAPVLEAPGALWWENRLSQSGRKVISTSALTVGDGSDRLHQRLIVVDVASGDVMHTDVVFDKTFQTLTYALSADDQTLAVGLSEQVALDDGGTAPLRMTLSLRRGLDMSVVVERRFPGCYIGQSSTDQLLQWSPDGRFLALQLREPDELYDSLIIVDAATLETVYWLRDGALMGSLSWSSESDRLAVMAHADEPRILHVREQRLEELSWLPGRRVDPPRGPQLLGLLDEGRALVMLQTRRRVRLLLADVQTGQGPVAAAYPVTDDDWPNWVRLSRAWDQL